MGKRDVALIRYFEDEERYADILNVFIFRGQQKIQACDIMTQDSKANGIVKRLQKRFLVQKYRDLIRRVVMGIQFVLIGLEHQDQVHYAMPVRIMLEDAALYDEQLRKIQRLHRRRKDLKGAEFLGQFAKSDRLVPVFTIVLYYGEEPWDGAVDLYGLLDCAMIPAELKGMLNNYRIHILDVRRFPDSGLFQTDLQFVFEYIRHSHDKEAMLRYTDEHHKIFEALEEDTFDVIAALSGAEELMQVKEGCLEGGKVNMCRALTELIHNGRMQGLKEGLKEGLQEGLQKGALEKSKKIAHNMFLRNMSAEDAAALCSEDLELVRSWYQEWK